MFLTVMFNSLCDDGCPSVILKSILKPIPKPRRDSTISANLRPLTITSIWYRILSKVFTQRLGNSLFSPR